MRLHQAFKWFLVMFFFFFFTQSAIRFISKWSIKIINIKVTFVWMTESQSFYRLMKLVSLCIPCLKGVYSILQTQCYQPTVSYVSILYLVPCSFPHTSLFDLDKACNNSICLYLSASPSTCFISMISRPYYTFNNDAEVSVLPCIYYLLVF